MQNELPDNRTILINLGRTLNAIGRRLVRTVPTLLAWGRCDGLVLAARN